MEDPVVFDEVHRFAFELVRAGRGHRAAHRSRRRPVRAGRLPAAAAGALSPPTPTPPIRSSSSSRRSSAPASSSPSDWPVHGTTGYEFARDRQQPVRRPPQRARVRRHLPPHRPRAAAVVRRSRLPLQEAGAARDDVGRHQLARPPAQSLLRAQPPLPRLHALQPDLDAEGSDRLVSRSTAPTSPPTEPVSDHDRRYIAEAVRTARRRAPAVSRLMFDFVERLLLKSTGVGDARGGRGAGAVHRQAAADDQPGRRQGHRRHRALRLQPAGVAERSRRRSDRSSGSSRRRCTTG